jgi:hypothetical protein
MRIPMPSQLHLYTARRRSFVEMMVVVTFMLLLSVFTIQPVFAQQGALAFTAETSPAPTAGQVITKLTWATTPAATSCTASGDTAWTGTKAASGTVTLAAASPPKSYALKCSWPGDSSAALTWVAPTTNTDGTPLAKCAAATDTGPCLAKYRIYHGASATTLTDVRDHNFPGATSSTWTGLTAGTHFFGIKAVTGEGAESALSNVVSKTIGPAFEVTQSVGVKVPSAATALAVQ